MPKCPVCYGYPFDGERCPICGFPADLQRIAYWELVYRHPEKPQELFRRPFPINYERAKVWKKMLETRGYEARIMPVYAKSNPQEILMLTRPMSWNYVGSFIDAEGSIKTYITRGVFHAEITITQKNRIVGGLPLLQEINNFIYRELGITGRITELRPNIYELKYYRMLDVYKLAVATLPYLHHPQKIRQAIDLIEAIENHTKRIIAITQKRIPTTPPEERLILYRILRTAQTRLREIQKIKEEYPYIKTVLAYVPPS